ncbi:FAD-binding oxidoreductase [Pelagibius sp. Alg239-R121]|uniref:NAD(P)/FAD-dependent oxidoreductase n=1 Tax=Pelagibius sp. Alg239-R121 TaxID=2993448 RepID=UPI0024A71090|nr:FAD-binding oxidoreductase [Pelagibius sp. Alg239-R121]
MTERAESKQEMEIPCLVIGAGIVGLCTAISLQERGIPVTLIDPEPPAEAASYGNAGVLSTWSCVPQSMPGVWKSVPKWLLDPDGPAKIRWTHLPSLLPWIIAFLRAGRIERIPAIADAMLALNQPTIELYRRHLQGTGKEHLVRDSNYVFVYRDPAKANLDALEWRIRDERGTPLERIENGALRDLEPDISEDYRAAILVKGQGRATDPGAIGKALAEKITRQGGQFLRGKVRRLIPQDNGCFHVEADNRSLAAAKVVLAAGPWSATLLKPLGFRLPLEAERGYHMIFADPDVALNNSVMVTDSKFVASSMDMGLRCAGTAEFAKLDAPPDYRRAEVFKRQAKRLLPKLNTETTDVWMGQRPSFPDSLPALGPLPGLENLTMAFGHGHLGMTAAPMTGRIAAALVAGEPPNLDLTPYSLERFQ